MAFVLAPQPWLVFLDDDGHFVPSGQLAVYAAGTSTPAIVYADSAGTPHPFPITLDGAGRVPGGLYLQPGLSYKFVLHAPKIVLPLSGAILKTQDNVQGGGGLLAISGTVPTSGDLPATGQPGDAYIALDTGHLWIWDATSGTWVDAGPIQGPPGPPGVPAAHAPTHETGGTDPVLHLAGEVVDSGTLADARLSLNVPLKNTINTFTNIQRFAFADPFVQFFAPNQLANQRLWQFGAFGNMAITALADDGSTIQGNVIFGRDGGVFLTGALQATGLGTTPVPAGNLTGTIVDARLSVNVLTHPAGYPGGAVNFLRADGTFAPPPGGSIPGPHAPTHETGGSDPILHLAGSVIDTGVVADARLSVNVLKHTAGYPGGTVNFLRADGSFAAPPTGGIPSAHRTTHETGGSDALQALSASILTTGQLPDARLTVNVLRATGGYPGGTTNFLRADGNFAAPSGVTPAAHATTHNTGGGDALTALSGAVITTGTVADARLSTNVPFKSTANTFALAQTAPVFAAEAATFPALTLTETSQPANARAFRLLNNSQVLQITPTTDAGVAGNGLALSRTGVVSAVGQIATSLTRNPPDQGVSVSTLTAVLWDVEAFDVGGCHAGSSQNLTVPAGGDGLYLVLAQVEFSGSGVGVRIVQLRRNGATIVASSTIDALSSTGAASVQVQTILSLVATEFIDVVVFHNAAGPLGVTNNSTFKWVKLW